MKNKNFFGNTRGLAEYALDIWSILVFIIVLFFFFVVFKIEAINAHDQQLIGAREIPTSSLTLVNYLRTPATVDGKEITVGELIRLWNMQPDKYGDTLKKFSNDLLNNLEYEYKDSQTNNIRIRGFDISINSGKNGDNSLDYLMEFKSKNFESGYCELNEYGCIKLGEQFIPVSEDKSLYLVLFESHRAK